MGVTEKRDNEKNDLLITLARDAIARRLKIWGVPDTDANQIAVEASEDIRKAFGGGHHYIPKNAHGRMAERNRRIFDEFKKGRSYEELSKEFDLTEMRIRQVVEIVRRERRHYT